MRSSITHTLRGIAAAGVLLASIPRRCTAHSHIAYVVVDGLIYPGFDTMKDSIPANTVGWRTSVTDDSFVPPSNYTHPDIICHRDASPAPAHVPVRAGDKVHVQWNGWPQSHVGPVNSYLASCAGGGGGCGDADKSALEFFKIDDGAPVLLSAAGGPDTRPGVVGRWATDVLIANNNSWVVQVPPGLAPGAYVLRHELIALHYAARPDGAQNYPQCVNLWVQPGSGGGGGGGGGAVGKGLGKRATELYRADDPGIAIDVSKPLATYVIPGPPVVSGAVPVPMAGQTEAVVKGYGTPVSVVGGTTAVPFPAVGKVIPRRKSGT